MLSINSLKRLKPLLPLLLTGILAGCAWLPEQVDKTKDWSASRFYSEAKSAMSEGNYQTAVNYYEKLQARYPFGRYAQQAQLDLIYVYYKDDEPDAAIAAADRFIRANPRHPFVDYAYYMKGLINFARDNSLAAKLMPSDRARTDPKLAQQAFNDFAELVRKFPDSKYAKDAQQRMVFLRNNLAAYEVNVAQYYLRRKAYVGAVNRAKYVLEHYDRSPAVADALVIMTEAYARMGLTDLAKDSLRVLQLNQPGSPYIAPLTALVEGRASGDGPLYQGS
ncbi:MAG TPA: outer membrane protein assembly factor BamD [Candidatus Competibacteraceae bacterium]|nr:outer membrane protein assembly factor BamD [Candidatus Competibacteraceae bacterium]